MATGQNRGGHERKVWNAISGDDLLTITMPEELNDFETLAFDATGHKLWVTKWQPRNTRDILTIWDGTPREGGGK
jgi:hypothetical protein